MYIAEKCIKGQIRDKVKDQGTMNKWYNLLLFNFNSNWTIELLMFPQQKTVVGLVNQLLNVWKSVAAWERYMILYKAVEQARLGQAQMECFGALVKFCIKVRNFL